MRLVGTLFLLMLVLSGCATQQPRETHVVQNLTVICCSEEEVNTAYQCFTLGRYPEHRVAGFQVRDTVYVRWIGLDANGKLMPDFETLGHELWHVIRGDFHR